MLGRASAAGVERILVPGIDWETSLKALELAQTHSILRAAVGWHPSHLPAEVPSAEARDRLVVMAMGPGATAIGETGLDQHHHDRSVLDGQLAWFEMQASVASALGKTLIVHSRKAEAEVAAAVAPLDGAPVVLHCYTGPPGVALELVEGGGGNRFLGFTGRVTHRSARAERDLLARIPRESVLIETDAPFMAPHPVRGGPSEPSFLHWILEEVARTWGCDPATAARQLWKNSERALQLGRWRRTDLVYRLGGRIYVNVTGRCNNDCVFCVRRFQDGIGGYLLDHSGEEGPDPDAAALRRVLDLLPAGVYDEVVFCGYGEPTLRHGLVRELARRMRASGWRTRLNTNGLMLSFAGREEARRLVSVMDSVSVSLNCPDAESYERVCRPTVEDAYDRLLEFIRLCSDSSCETRLTAVRHPGVDLRGVRRRAAELGLPLRTRG